MAFDKPYDINPNPGGDTVKQSILNTDLNVDDIYSNLNLLLAQIGLLPNDGQEILDLLLTVDGAGSGLDADKLDGFEATHFATSSHDHPEATSSAPGFISPLDKQKIDSIASGAEVNVQSDWAETNSSEDAFLRNKPKILEIEGTPQSGNVTVFTGPTSIHGSNEQEMQTLLGYYTSAEFISQTAGSADAGKPIVLGVDGLIHASMIPAVPAQAIWGAITGTLANQTDLQDELDLKSPTNHNHDGVYEPTLGNPANDGEILSSTAAGVRSWIPAPSGGGGDAVWGSITGTLSDQDDLQNALDAKSDTGHNHDSLYFLETEFISISAGPADSGKPILLNSVGQIDASMLDVSVFHYIGPFTPVAGTEYPDPVGEDYGAFWVVQGVDAGTGYTFAGGDLAGLTVDNGDFMVWASAGWSIMAGEMNPTLYYKLDGTQPLTDPFAGGGQQLKAIADGTDDTDAVTVLQLAGKADVGHDHDTDYLSLDGGEISGVLRLTDVYPRLYINATGSGSPNLDFQKDGVTRFNLLMNTAFHFAFTRNDAAGSWIDSPLMINGDTGEVIFDKPVICPDAPTLNEHLVNKEYADSIVSGGATWGAIVGTLSDQTDLQDALDLKLDATAKAADAELLDGLEAAAFELALGNPTIDNQILVSLTNGTRGWATLPVTQWGGIEGTLASQTDLQTALDGKSPTGHNHDTDYLAVGGKAADSSLINGEPRTQFVSADDPDPAQGVDGDIWITI